MNQEEKKSILESKLIMAITYYTEGICMDYSGKSNKEALKRDCILNAIRVVKEAIEIEPKIKEGFEAIKILGLNIMDTENDSEEFDDEESYANILQVIIDKINEE
jgi:hypothetical protein